MASADPVAIHRRLGYLPGEWNLYDRLTGAETIRYFANLRGGVDQAYVDQLVQRLDLDPSRRFREYSQGQQAEGRARSSRSSTGRSCSSSTSRRPGSTRSSSRRSTSCCSRRKREGRTVFLSSHIISEVERTCDRVAIIREGRIVRVDTVEGVRATGRPRGGAALRRARAGGARSRRSTGVVNVVEEGRTLRMLVTGPIAPVVRLAGQYDLVDFVSREPSLEEVFLSEYASRPADGGRSRPMSTAARRPRRATVALPAPGLLGRLFGLGSIFGKTFRDSRRAALIVGVVTALILVVTAASARGRVRHRRRSGSRSRPSCGSLPADLPGHARRDDRNRDAWAASCPGGPSTSCRSSSGIWTVVAMSGLLAGELARGSLDFLASTPPISRARVALEKLGGYLVALLLAIGAVRGRRVSPRSPAFGDAARRRGRRSTRRSRTPPGCSSSSLVPGALAFAVAPFLGRGGGARRRRRSRSSRASSSAATPSVVSGASSRSSRCPTSRSPPATGRSPGVWDWPAVAAVGGVSGRRCSAIGVAGVRRAATCSSRPAAASGSRRCRSSSRAVHAGARRAAARGDRVGRGARRSSG